VTAVDSVAIGLLAPILTRFRAANPGVQVDLIIAEQTLNLSRRDADVAIRGANDPPESLVGRRICAIRWAVYCTPAMASEHGGRVVAAAPWVGFSSAPARAKRWTDEKIGPRRQVCAVNSVLAMAAMAAAGLGATVLPGSRRRRRA
jgi:DNA-binding transcriptional LysR family regulator